jgi:hypothetical protein
MCCRLSWCSKVRVQGQSEYRNSVASHVLTLAQVLLPSPRNPPATNLSLMEQTGSKTILHAAEVLPVIKTLVAASSALKCLEIPSFQEMLAADPPPQPFQKSYEEAQNDPIVILHSSGSTGEY